MPDGMKFTVSRQSAGGDRNRRDSVFILPGMQDTDQIQLNGQKSAGIINPSAFYLFNMSLFTIDCNDDGCLAYKRNLCNHKRCRPPALRILNLDHIIG